MAIELVVFDIAGTTVNDNDSVNGCLRAALESAGLAVTPAEVNTVMGLPKPEAIEILVKNRGMHGVMGDQIETIHRDFVARSVRFYAHDPSVHEIDGATRLFQNLREAGIRVALNTGFNRAITQVILDRLNWVPGHHIDASICSDEVPRGRPHPFMIHALMRQFGISDSAHVAKVGDTPVDLKEGHGAGCGLVIGVTWGTHTRQQLEPHPHTHLVDSIECIAELLAIETDLR